MGHGEVPAAQGSGVVRDVSIALISMLGSIAVAWIAILPQLRKSDADQINRLESQMEKLCQAYGCEGHAGTAWAVRGSVRPDEAGGRVGDYEVYLVPTRQMQTTLDDGSFSFEDVPPGSYAIVAREFASTGTVRGAINSTQTRDALSFRGARLEYRITDVQRADTTRGQGGRTALASAAEP